MQARMQQRAVTDRHSALCGVVQGTIPQVWMDMQTGPAKLRLRQFACAHCNLTGPMPLWGGNTTCAPEGSSLQFFDVSYNALSGTIPSGFNSFGGLQVFDVSHNQLSGPFLETSYCVGGKFPWLEQIRMSHNSFTSIAVGRAPCLSQPAAPCDVSTGASMLTCTRVVRPLHSCGNLLPACPKLRTSDLAATLCQLCMYCSLESAQLLEGA